jgi:hypothetical protein
LHLSVTLHQRKRRFNSQRQAQYRNSFDIAYNVALSYLPALSSVRTATRDNPRELNLSFLSLDLERTQCIIDNIGTTVDNGEDQFLLFRI